MIGCLGIMVRTMIPMSLTLSLYRSFTITASGNDDLAWGPSVITSYLRANSTNVASLLSTELANYVWSGKNSVVSNGVDSPYAYAFVVGGCSPEKPAYKNYIYNILIATRILRSKGSKADVFVFFQMSYNSVNDTLPEEDVRVLEAMNIKFRYIPKSKIENFFKTMLDKFRILGLTEYRRVLFLDGDVMPTGNLDYLFELSDGPDAILKPNLIITGRVEPANGGFFMLAPGEGELQEMNEIIHQREVKAQTRGYPYFDPVEGWGHEIQPPDKWNLMSGSGTTWTFWAAFADQGLLYHWVRTVLYFIGSPSAPSPVLHESNTILTSLLSTLSLCIILLTSAIRSSTPRRAYQLPTATRFRILEPCRTGPLSSKRLWIARLRIIPSLSNASRSVE
jgi:hypothetical protein